MTWPTQAAHCPPLPYWGPLRKPEISSALHLHALPRALLHTLPDNALHLQEEMNDAMSHILTP